MAAAFAWLFARRKVLHQGVMALPALTVLARDIIACNQCKRLRKHCEEVAQVKVPDESRMAFVTQTTLSISDAQRVIDAIRANELEWTDIVSRDEVVSYRTLQDRWENRLNFAWRK
jgi:4-hydroxy-3-methylbut-2-enyl diphosphate reductase IspH